MSSNDLFGAAAAFLAGDAGDVRTAVNGEQSGLLALGSVTVSRGPRGREARAAVSPDVTVEIVPVPAAPPRFVGIGTRERDVALDLRVTQRRKDRSPGAEQLALLDSVTRALVARYDAVFDLPIVVLGGAATFRRAAAQATATDQVPESSELARSVVRLVLTFTEEA